MSSLINCIKSILHSMLQLLWFGKKTITNSLSVVIKTNTGNTLPVDLDPLWDIRNVKDFLAPKLGIQPEEVKIIFAGKELGDSINLSDCDLGQGSILHALRVPRRLELNNKCDKNSSLIEESVVEEDDASKPLCATLMDISFNNSEASNLQSNSPQHRNELLSEEKRKSKAHFYVFCASCKRLCQGKMRIRCNCCKSGAFTVHADPQNWTDVLEAKQITGLCENQSEVCTSALPNSEPAFAEFYFKCAEHLSLGEKDQAVPLYLVRANIREVPCLACGDVSDTVFVYECAQGHVTCLDCFRQYCTVRLRDRQFWQHPELGYTLGCPAACPDSFIREIHHFRVLTEQQYNQYQRFATEEYVLQAGGVLCPQPGCGMGILADADCTKITCINGCGYVFCRLCLQGFHIGECIATETNGNSNKSCADYSIDPARAVTARWDEASNRTIKVMTKPCPKCRTPTERDGGCMHMVCTRAGCQFHWCWVCQTEWTRDCMGSHWFG